MPEMILYLDNMENVIVDSYSKKWKLNNKKLTIKRMIKMFRELEEMSERREKEENANRENI